jgi:hypothetical protein
MISLNRRHALQLMLASGTVLLARPALSLEREGNGYYLTGSGVRVKPLGPFSVNVYAISHFMRELPPVRSKAAVIAMDTDKAFTWRLLRSLEAKQIRDALDGGFAKNGYTDRANIDRFLGAFTKGQPEGTTVQIRYGSAAKTTTLSVTGDGTAIVPGLEFMHAVWSVWFGKIDQPDLSDALIRRIPEHPSTGG